MKPKHLYAVLCVIGSVLPLWQFALFLRQHGFDLAALLRQAFATPGSSFFALDVVTSALTLIAFTAIERARAAVRYRWIPLLALVTVGVSLALPLFLYLREDRVGGAMT
jgi:hypothetical protein